MRRIRSFLENRADDVAVLMLTAMFLSFVVQIVWRYVFNHPLGWTLELCLTLWLWTVFWGAAFCLRDNDHVRFDMLYLHVTPKLRRVFAGISAVAIIIAMIAAAPGTWDFVSFLTIKKSGTMRIPLAYVFSIYLIFMAAAVVTYAWRLKKILGKDADRFLTNEVEELP
jgi:TRAP-type C4-dicarboxylate transport system permease small subunit